MARPEGPEGSPTSAGPEGRPSINVRRVPFGSMIEIRPDNAGVTDPTSATSRLPWFVRALPCGPRKPETSGLHCASAETARARSAAEVKKLRRVVFIGCFPSQRDRRAPAAMNLRNLYGRTRSHDGPQPFA